MKGGKCRDSPCGIDHFRSILPRKEVVSMNPKSHPAPILSCLGWMGSRDPNAPPWLREDPTPSEIKLQLFIISIHVLEDAWG